MGHSIRPDRIAQRLPDVLLADDLVKGLRTKPPRHHGVLRRLHAAGLIRHETASLCDGNKEGHIPFHSLSHPY